MLFNSIEYLIFLPLVFLLYWFVFNKRHVLQNLFLIAAGLLFYGWWDWRFLILLLFTAGIDYLVGRLLEITEVEIKRKWIIFLSLAVNIGVLGFFKYFNFFADSLITAFNGIGIHLQARSINIALPVGISFYTFQSMSYTIDVYRRKILPERNVVTFFAFITFFPPLVAGPIERASNMLPQFSAARSFNIDKAKDGLKIMLWGFLKKMVIADGAAILCNNIFGDYRAQTGSTLLLGAFYFSIQIYCDFSGYSDIARGTANLFGFDLMRNFNFPYFSRNIAEFWRKWHISLSTWFRDYLYIPLGGSKGNTLEKIRNTFIIFIVSGFWHGANWTFIFWGALHAIYFLPLLLFNKNRSYLDVAAKGKLLPSGKEILQMACTFFLVMFAWIFFRSATIHDAFACIKIILSKSLFSLPRNVDVQLLILISAMLVIEWLQREQPYVLHFGQTTPVWKRWVAYYTVFLSIYFFAQAQQQFIYFQF